MVKSRNHDEKTQDSQAGALQPRRFSVATSRTIIHQSGAPFDWLSFRTPTAGPELELVHDYLAKHIPPPPKGQALSIFLEPEIESGFPDIVAVYWNQRVASDWASCRAELTAADIRVAHFLATAGDSDRETLKYFFRSQVSCTLERLHAANMIRQVGGVWRARPLGTIFAARRLLAIEAKVTNPREGLQQAVLNMWFASESYLLLPKLPSHTGFVEETKRFGVGLLTRELAIDASAVGARQDRIPKSYASWLFNEWAWLASAVG